MFESGFNGVPLFQRENMKLRAILLILGLVAFFSVTASGILYYFSLRTSILSDAETRSEYYTVMIDNFISTYINDNQKAVQALAELKELQPPLLHLNQSNLEKANLILDRFNDALEGSVSYLMDRNGRTIASSNRQDAESFVGKNYSFRPYFEESIHGNSSVYMALGITSKKRGIYYSYPIFGVSQNRPIGVVVLKADVDEIEREFINNTYYNSKTMTFVTDPHGIIFMSDHKKFLYHTLWRISDEKTNEVLNSNQFGKGPLEWSGFKRENKERVVDGAGNEYLVFQKVIASLPGWNIVHLHNIKVLSNIIADPFIGTIVYVILALCVLIGPFVFILYNMGKSDIIRRVEMEKTLREREAFIKLVLDNLPIGIAVNTVDPDVKFEYMNDNFLKFYRTTKEALADPNAFWNAVYEEPSFREEIKKKVLDDCTGGDPGSMYWADVPITRKGEETSIITARNIPIPDKQLMISTVWDVTERKRTEEELRQSEELHRIVTNSIWDSIAIIQEEKVMWVNNVALEKMGYTEDELIGLDFQKVIHPDDLPGAIQRYQDRMSGKPVGDPSYLRLVTKDGQILEVEDRGAVITWAGKPAIVQTLRDITEEKRKKEERKKLEARLRQAQKMEAIGTLAGGIAHDFNNILFSLLGFSEMLKEDLPADSPLQRYADEVIRAALRAKDLVKQILTFSRQGDQDIKPIRLGPIVKEAVKLLRSFIPTNIEIEQDIDSNCGVVVADPTQMHQIVMNLVTNAYHAMEETGGRLKLQLRTVHLESEQTFFSDLAPGEYDLLAVSDTGIGIDKDVLDKIFDPYFTTKEEGKGTGLGLSVVLGIVKSCNGDIRIYSEPGKGTEVRIYLPVMDRKTADLRTDISEPVRGGTEKILVVDDEAAIARMERQMLERLGYRIIVRTGSTDALEAFKADPHSFDLVLTDMTMPNMTGVQLAGEIKKIRPDIPIILCTGFSYQINDIKSKALGIQGFVMKPVVKKEIAETIRNVLDNIG
jgi:PAS domain S-box-containing protein